MKVIRSHKSYFRKVTIAGIAIFAVSIVLFFAIERSARDGLLYQSNREVNSYFERLELAAEQFAERNIGYVIFDFKERLRSGGNIDEAIESVKLGLEQRGLEQTYFWFLEEGGDIYSSHPEVDFLPLKVKLQAMESAGADNATLIFQDRLYVLTYRSLEGKAHDPNYERRLILALPGDQVYDNLDWDNRIVGIDLDGIPSDDLPGALINNVVSIPLTNFNGSRLGLIYVKRLQSHYGGAIVWGWGMIVFFLFPIAIVVLLAVLAYRYFDSFSSHSDALRKILKPDNPGAEIFRRDQEVVEKYMPELSEIFNLANESVSEKMYYQRSTELINTLLDIVCEKGFNHRSLSEVLEILVGSLNGYGGAIIAPDASNNAFEVFGRYNFSEELIHSITKTPRGLRFLKYVHKHDSCLNFNNIPVSSSKAEWDELFTGYEQVIACPLKFESETVGVVIIVATAGPMNTSTMKLSDMIVDLLSALTHWMTLEKDISLGSEGTRILQETSLAISSTLELGAVLRVVAKRLTDYASAVYCMILLNIEGSDFVQVASFYSNKEGVYESDKPEINPVGFPKLAGIFRAKRTSVLGAQDLSDFSSEEKSFFNTEHIKSLVILPISHSAKFIGFIILGEEKSGTGASRGTDKLNFMQAMASQAASAIENARLYGFIKRKVDQLTASYNVSAAIHSEIDVDSMLSKVLQATEGFLHNSFAVIYSNEDDTRKLMPLACRGYNLEFGRNSDWRVGNDSIPGLVASTGDSIIVDDIRLDTNLLASFPEALSELAVPIKIGEKVIGVFSVGSTTKNSFTGLDEEFLHSLARQIAVAMERARLFDQERERGLRLKTIFDFSRKLSSTLDLRKVLKLAVDSIREAFDYHLVAIFLIDHEENRFFIGDQSAAPTKRIPQDFTLDLNKGLLGKVIGSRKSLYSADVSRDLDYVPAVAEIKSEVCIPIIAAETIIGVLDVESMDLDAFGADDINTLEALADILAVAVDNSYLLKETTEKADRLSLIDKINTAISAALDLDSFFKVVAKAVADNAGYQWALLVVPDGDTFTFKSGYAQKSVGNIDPGPVLDFLGEKLREVFSSGAPDFIEYSNMSQSGIPEGLRLLQEANIRHLALYPISDAGNSEAILIVGSSRARGFGRQELSLLNDLAVHLRNAWHNARLYERLKTAYRQLQEAQDKIVQTEKLRALGEMSSGVVHDFNNILAAILGRVQLVHRRVDKAEDNPLREFLAKNLEVIEKAAADGSHILSRINEFTKGKPSEKFVNLHVDQIITDAIELTRPRWRDQAVAAGKKIDVEFRGTASLQTTGDPSELREVFTNLIINAVDAIQREGKISISATLESDDLIRVLVEDNGEGMTDETKKRLFEPFFTTKGTRGTGLGLSVTYGIINRHGGNVEVQSGVREGTKFIITIPVRRLNTGDEKELEMKNQGATKGAILVVDDEESLLDVLSEILISGGHDVDTALSGNLAIEALSRKKYDLVITDLGMEDMSGWELADVINAKYPQTKIIVATGWGAQVEPGNLRLHHVNGLISKPFKILDVQQAAKAVLSCSRDEVLIDKA